MRIAAHLLSVGLVLLAFSPLLRAMDPAYQKALDENLKVYPPGDYGPEQGIRPFISSRAVLVEPDRKLPDEKKGLEERLESLVIPLMEYKDIRGLDAFRILIDECAKSEPEGEPIRIAFDIRLLSAPEQKKLEDPSMSLHLKDTKAKKVLYYIVELLNLRYEVHGSFILILPRDGK